MELRDYQKDMIQKIYSEWQKGSKNVLMQLPTGGGKTILFCQIIYEMKVPTIAIAHRVELVSQISLTLARYGIQHNILAQKTAIREIIGLHMTELGSRYYNPSSPVIVAGVDTLIRLGSNRPNWFNQIQLVIQDEGHHPLKENKWGKVSEFFLNALGIYPTATPIRADGKGLGRHADGIIDSIITGPPMRILIEDGYLTDYLIYAPPTNIDLSQVNTGATGDYNQHKLREVVHESCIVGDVVSHYLKIAKGKLGVTFAVDVEHAREISEKFNASGIRAEVICAKTPDLIRHNIMRRFKKREILQLVNVDLLGEGVDVPAIEVVSFARPTKSYALYSQQFGRALRPLRGKDKAIIIDHVGNVITHGLPDAPRLWSLDRRDRKKKYDIDEIQIKVCTECFRVYEKFLKQCPYCGHVEIKKPRGKPDEVDGELILFDDETLRHLRGEINKIDNVPYLPKNIPDDVHYAIIKRHRERQEKQKELRNSISIWAAFYNQKGYEDDIIHRKFYLDFGIDILTAQSLGRKDANNLKEKIEKTIDELVISM